jgi:hypothetical protein
MTFAAHDAGPQSVHDQFVSLEGFTPGPPGRGIGLFHSVAPLIEHSPGHSELPCKPDDGAQAFILSTACRRSSLPYRLPFLRSTIKLLSPKVCLVKVGQARGSLQIFLRIALLRVRSGKRQMRWFVNSLDSWGRSMIGPWDRLGRCLRFETTGSLPRADSQGVSFSTWFPRSCAARRTSSELMSKSFARPATN